MRKLVIIMGILIFSCCKTNGENIITPEPKKLEINEDSTIICFGDSLTYGKGRTSIEESYPMTLQKSINIKVINSGVESFDTTTDGLERIERDVLAYNPVIVLIGFGGNDLYYPPKKLSIKKIENNFKEMIKLLDNRNREIYIVRFFNDEMRFLDIFYRFDRMLNRIQKEYPNVRIIKNIWEGVWGKKEYKYDLSHPNSKGNVIIANNIFNEIKDVLEYNNLIK
jgi:lysophospholipase L1-like esterase